MIILSQVAIDYCHFIKTFNKVLRQGGIIGINAIILGNSVYFHTFRIDFAFRNPLSPSHLF